MRLLNNNNRSGCKGYSGSHLIIKQSFNLPAAHKSDENVCLRAPKTLISAIIDEITADFQQHQLSFKAGIRTNCRILYGGIIMPKTPPYFIFSGTFRVLWRRQ